MVFLMDFLESDKMGRVQAGGADLLSIVLPLYHGRFFGAVEWVVIHQVKVVARTFLV